MIDLRDVHPLSDFQRNTKAFLKRLRQTGRPIVLTVNGRAALVIRDAARYQEALDQHQADQLAQSLRRGVESVKRGGGRPFEQAFAEIAAKHIDEHGRARRRKRRAA